MKNNDNEKGPLAPFLLRDMTDRQTDMDRSFLKVFFAHARA
jgi:hypothetical protein